MRDELTIRENQIKESVQSFLNRIDTSEETRLPQRAYLAIRHAICYLHLPPGRTVLEREMTNMLEMSRTPVREALVRLEMEGWIQIIPRRGFVVAPIEAEPLHEIFEVTAALDGVAGALAAGRATDDELRALNDVIDAQEEALRDNALLKWAELDDRFHTLIIDMAHNQRLRGLMDSLSDQVYRARLYTIERREKPTRSILEHRIILATLRTGEAEATRILLERHRKRGSDEVMQILKTESEESSHSQ